VFALTTLPPLVSAESLSQRVATVRMRIADAARRTGRDPAEVVLIGAAKTVAPERVREAVEAGLEDIGENRVQEAEAVFAVIGRRARWHMIGHLQRNKAGRAAEIFDRVHGLDRLETAVTLADRAARQGRRIAALIEVNVSGEPSKHGVAPAAAAMLAEKIAALEGLALDGLMSIGTPVETPGDARREFAATRELRDSIARSTGLSLPQLSMGMSGDYEVAVEEGATMVRVGTALFGARERGEA
jgi:pyridoxal phosphate enzyme (YggS family)